MIAHPLFDALPPGDAPIPHPAHSRTDGPRAKRERIRIAVISDIHAMHHCLAAALEDARREGFDTLLILGDLLTYGVAPVETLALVDDAVARDRAVLVAGNHDQIYLGGGDVDYLSRLPDWLRETIDWTAARIDACAMAAFDWKPYWASGSLFAAHANPYAFGDWTYLSDQASAVAAAHALGQRGYRHGLFGHTHRARHFAHDGISIHTIGSLGQPRDATDRDPQWAMVTIADDHVTVAPRRVAFDRDEYRAAVRATSMSHPTQERLLGFFS